MQAGKQWRRNSIICRRWKPQSPGNIFWRLGSRKPGLDVYFSVGVQKRLKCLNPKGIIFLNHIPTTKLVRTKKGQIMRNPTSKFCTLVSGCWLFHGHRLCPKQHPTYSCGPRAVSKLVRETTASLRCHSPPEPKSVPTVWAGGYLFLLRGRPFSFNPKAIWGFSPTSTSYIHILTKKIPTQRNMQCLLPSCECLCKTMIQIWL